MSWLYLSELAVDSSPANGYTDGEQSATSSESRIQWRSLKRELETECSTMPPFGLTFAVSRNATTNAGDSSGHSGKYLTVLLSRRDSHASRSASPANGKGQTTIETYGQIPFVLLEKSGHDMSFWRTYQDCLPGLTGISAQYSESWPKAGMMRSGVCYRRPSWERRIGEIGSGLWPTIRANKWGLPDSRGRKMDINGPIPTPRANERGNYQYDRGDKTKPRPTLTGWVRMQPEVNQWLIPTPSTAPEAPNKNANTKGPKNLLEVAETKWMPSMMWPTPTARDGRNRGPSEGNRKSPALNHVATNGNGGQLNPPWVEWLMGWPIGWAGLEPLERDRFLSWLRQHGIC